MYVPPVFSFCFLFLIYRISYLNACKHIFFDSVSVKYWFKYCARNWPEALLSIPVFGIILPTILAYKAYRNSDEEYSKMSTRFKTEYVGMYSLQAFRIVDC